jgi:hypothetical protein
MGERHHCGCCGNEIGAGTRTDPEWCARCKPHIANGQRPAWEKTHFAQTGRDCPYQVGSHA